jgi:multidrug efflux pump subunit AcrB
VKPAGLIGWFAANHVAANLLMAFIILTGVYSVITLKKETMPPIKSDTIDISVLYLGAAPAEVEEGVVVKIEEAIEAIEGIEEIRSVASEGVGRVSAEVDETYDVLEVMDEIKLAVDGISTFPGETERPIISRSRWRHGAIVVQVGGDLDEATMTSLADEIKDEIIALPEVSYAEVWGARAFEVSVEVSEATLKQFELTLDEVARAIRNWSVDLPGGNIRSPSGDIRLRAKGQAYTGKDFESIVVRTQGDGTRVRLVDIATIKDEFEEVESYAFFNGRRSLGISVFTLSEENELDVAQAVKDYVANRQETLPTGVELELWKDATEHLRGRINMMLKNLALGAILVFTILGVFLHARIAAWVIVGLPVAFFGTFMMLPVTFVGVSINALSLFGFILVLGIVVDDAIIIAESAYAETEKNGYNLNSIVTGARRVAVPATFGVLTTIMAFLPLLFTSGPSAPMSEAIGWVVVLCLAFSLVESKLILPSHLALMTSSHKKAGIADVVDAKLRHFIRHHYQPFLRRSIEHRYSTLATFVGLLIIAAGLVIGGKVRYVFFPDIEADYVSANIELLDGAPESLIHAIVIDMDLRLGEVNDALKAELGTDTDVVKNTFAYIRDGTYGQFQVELAKNDQLTPTDFERRWRDAVGEIAGTKELTFSASANMGGGPPIAFKLTGRSYQQLELAAAELEAHLKTFEGLFQINSSAQAGPEEVRLRVKPEAEALGITLADLARQVRGAFYGVEAQRIQRGDQEVKVMVRYPRSDRRSLGNLENMWIRTPDGRELPFHAVAETQLGAGYNNIRRVNGDRAVTVSARADYGIAEPAQVRRDVLDNYLPNLAQRYPGLRWNTTGGAREEELAFGEIVSGFIIALFGIYALMAIPLKSYLEPLIIMGVIPFGIVGAVVGHLLLGMNINIISILGIVALSGVVVNDSLIMVDFVNKSVADGMSEEEAVVRSGGARLRPILLTSLTTFFGLVPILLETSTHAQMVIPMAVSLSFGILFATLITLVLVPSLYLVLGDLRATLGLPRTIAGSRVTS